MFPLQGRGFGQAGKAAQGRVDHGSVPESERPVQAGNGGEERPTAPAGPAQGGTGPLGQQKGLFQGPGRIVRVGVGRENQAGCRVKGRGAVHRGGHPFGGDEAGVHAPGGQGLHESLGQAGLVVGDPNRGFREG